MAMDFSLTYGDDSSAERPLSIQAADIHFEAVPSLRIVLITMRLTIVNDAVCRDIEAALRTEFDLRADPAPRGSAPARLWLVDGGPSTVGIIASVSEAFCAACDRTRLTADGQVRNCLFATEETDLRGLLRSGADDATLDIAWRTAMWRKAAGHGINDPGFVQPQRPMSAIGG
jgi:molybdenum cofactor biosynthesis enzyme MoaA